MSVVEKLYLCNPLYTNRAIMNKTEKQIAQAAERFAKRWEGKGYEKGESQMFWTELLKAHRDNDRTVIAAYGFPATLTESDIVAHLFTLYSNLVK